MEKIKTAAIIIALIMLSMFMCGAKDKPDHQIIEITQEQATYWEQTEDFLFLKDGIIKFLEAQLRAETEQAHNINNERIVELKLDRDKQYKLVRTDDKIYLEEVAHVRAKSDK